MTDDSLIKLTFLGDIMCDLSQLEVFGTKAGYGFGGILDNLKDYFKTSDYVVGNLETPIAGEKLRYSFEEYRMNAPIEFAKVLKESKINLVSTANNHCLDRGVRGLKNTVKNLDQVGLEHVGTYAKKNKKHYFIKNISGVNIAFLSYTYGTNAFDNKNYLNKKDRFVVDLFQNQELSGIKNRIVFSGSPRKYVEVAKKVLRKLDPALFEKQIYEVEESNRYWKKQLKRDIRECKKQADIVVMLAHIGGQYNEEPSEYTKKITEWLLKQGVDSVVCNHEHVVHPVKVQENKVVAYALGDFLGPRGTVKAARDKLSGYSLLFNIYVDKRTKEKVRYTFSICKTILDQNKRQKNVLLYDLIQNEKNQNTQSKLLRDNNSIYRIVLDKKPGRPMNEYLIWEKL